MTFAEVAEEVNRNLGGGKKWTSHTVWDATIGRKREGQKRLRKLSPNELAAICRVFHVSLVTLLLPPKGERIRFGESSFSRKDYGWLVFKFPPQWLDKYEETLGDAAQDLFSDLVAALSGEPGDGISDHPLLREFIGSPLAEDAATEHLQERVKDYVQQLQNAIYQAAREQRHEEIQAYYEAMLNAEQREEVNGEH